jgi:hypothetical protein
MAKARQIQAGRQNRITGHGSRQKLTGTRVEAGIGAIMIN